MSEAPYILFQAFILFTDQLLVNANNYTTTDGMTTTMLWLILAAIFAAAVVCWSLRRRRGVMRLHRAMPCDWPNYPFIGHAHEFRGTNEDRMNAIQQVGRQALKRGGHTSFFLLHKLYVVIANPESMAVVTKTCLEKDEATMKYIRMVLGNGLIFAPVKIWRPRRKIMAPTFNTKNLQQFVKIFDQQSAVMAALLRARIGQGDFSIWNYVTTYTFDGICESTLGIKMNSQKLNDHPFIHSFDVLTKIIARRMLSPWLYWDWVFRLTPLHKQFVKHRRLIFEFCDQIIRDRRKQLLSQEIVKDDNEDYFTTFLDSMIMTSGGDKGYSDLELREEMLSIVSAGTDTSAVGTSFTILMLSRHPDVQDKVYKELQDVFEDSDRPVTWEDLPKLQYMEMVIKETLRLYPPAPAVVREVHEKVELPCGQTLLPGMALLLHIWGSHRNAEYWGADAEQFRPERFLEPLRHPAQYIPFSYSVRNCVGFNYAMMSTKTNLANLLRRYVVQPPAALSPAALAAPLRVEFDIMMKHVDNYLVRLEHRRGT